jgi:hypothetical protein
MPTFSTIMLDRVLPVRKGRFASMERSMERRCFLCNLVSQLVRTAGCNGPKPKEASAQSTDSTSQRSFPGYLPPRFWRPPRHLVPNCVRGDHLQPSADSLGFRLSILPLFTLSSTRILFLNLCLSPKISLAQYSFPRPYASSLSKTANLWKIIMWSFSLNSLVANSKWISRESSGFVQSCSNSGISLTRSPLGPVTIIRDWKFKHLSRYRSKF